MTIHSGRPTPNPELNTWPLPDGLRARLRREHGWTETFAEQAEAEYRRFVYLATLGRAVTPSPAVDEVWHTHLMFTRDYWGGFQALLPAPLHHEPGTDTPGDAVRLREQYLDTLALYERTFGEAAPATCWPRPAAPTSPTPRPAASGGLWGWAGVALLGLGGAVLTGTPVFLLLTALVFGFLAVWRGRRGDHTGHGDGAAGAGGLVLFGLDMGGADSGSGGDSGSSNGGSSNGGSSDGGSSDGGSCGSGCGSGCGGGCGS